MDKPKQRPTFGERIPIDRLVDLLNRLETIEAVAEHFSVNRRTIERAIEDKVERHYCWRRIVTVDAVSDVPAPNGACGK